MVEEARTRTEKKNRERKDSDEIFEEIKNKKETYQKTVGEIIEESKKEEKNNDEKKEN